MSPERPQILVVDDDNLLLKIIRNSLDDKHFEFVPAVGGKMALEVLKSKDYQIKVIVSDMIMPEMDGLQLLGLMQREYPDITRILLTGSNDIAYIAEILNQIGIFRFIRKPINPPVFNKTVNDAVEYFHQMAADREVVQNTLSQSVDALMKILEITNGVAFSLSQHVREYAIKLGKEIDAPAIWNLDIAAQLSQLGCITIPELILERYYWDDTLTPKEESMVRNHPQISLSILRNIPRLEHIGNTLIAASQRIDKEGFENGEAIAIHSAVIKFVTTFELLIRKGRDRDQAIEILEESKEDFPAVLIEAFKEVEVIQPKSKVIDLEIDKIKNGMWIEEDVKTKDGVLIVSKGYRVNEAVRNRLVNFSDEGEIEYMVKVRVSR